MAAPINDEFFDKAVALSIASLDYAIGELQNSHSKDTDKFKELDDAYEEVEDIAKFKELNKQLQNLTNDVFTNETLLKENKDIYVNLHESIYVNQYLETLLDSTNGKGIQEKDAINFLDDNFRSLIQQILNIKDLADSLDDQMIKILQVLKDEKSIKDMNDGISIVLTSMVNSKQDINNVFDLVVKADATESFLYFLNVEDNDKNTKRS